MPERFCRTPAQVILYGEGLTEDGGPEVIFSGEIRCNYQDKGKTVLTAEKKLIKLSGGALKPGDAFPEEAAITGGKITVFGVTRRIWQGEKARNPDGTVNYTRLDVE